MRARHAAPTLQAHLLGPHPLVRHYLQRLTFREIIRGCLGAGLRHSLDHAEVLAVVVHNVLVSRGPLYRIREWAQRIEPAALGLTASQVERLNDDRIARSLEALASERGRNVFFRLALRAIKDFELTFDRVHFDTTTVTFFGQYATSVSEPRITYGVNKDHRPDLKQLLFGLNVTCDGAVPLLHHVFSGNRTDDSTHVRNVDLLRTLLQTEDFIYVADSKLCTSDNLEHIAAYGGRFVTVLPRTHKEDQLFRRQLREQSVPVRWRKIHQIENRRRRGGPPDIYASTCDGPQENIEGYRLVWLRSSQKTVLDALARAKRVRKAELALRTLAGRLDCGKLRDPGEVKRRVSQILADHKADGLLNVQVITLTEVEHQHLRPGRPRPGDPVRVVRRKLLHLEVMRDKGAERREARTDGVFALVTNIVDQGKREILEIYKYQPYLEKRFALIKSEYGIAPVFLKKPVRVVALLQVYFVAMMVAALLERQVRAAMRTQGMPKIAVLPEGRLTSTPTAPRILENFDDVSWYQYEEGDRVVQFPVELTATQKLLLELSATPRHLYA